MSGGHFDYIQSRISSAAEEVAELIESNDDKTLNRWGNTEGRNYPPEIIAKFIECEHWLARSAEMLQRVDWLVSGDDGPESFLSRWKEEVRDA